MSNWLLFVACLPLIAAGGFLCGLGEWLHGGLAILTGSLNAMTVVMRMIAERADA